jgi:hypothetical protein
LGLRRLQARAGNLWLDGRRWVFRAARVSAIGPINAAECASSMFGLVLNGWSDQMAAEASLAGAPLAVQLGLDTWQSELCRAARCPAVQLAILPASWTGDASVLRQFAPNLLFVADLIGNNDLSMPSWPDAILIAADRRELQQVCRLPSRPPILVETLDRPAGPDDSSSIQSWRRDCERLQALLAPQFDLNGYIVRPNADRWNP